MVRWRIFLLAWLLPLMLSGCNEKPYVEFRHLTMGDRDGALVAIDRDGVLREYTVDADRNVKLRARQDLNDYVMAVLGDANGPVHVFHDGSISRFRNEKWEVVQKAVMEGNPLERFSSTSSAVAFFDGENPTWYYYDMAMGKPLQMSMPPGSSPKVSLGTEYAVAEDINSGYYEIFRLPLTEAADPITTGTAPGKREFRPTPISSRYAVFLDGHGSAVQVLNLSNFSTSTIQLPDWPISAAFLSDDELIVGIYRMVYIISLPDGKIKRKTRITMHEDYRVRYIKHVPELKLIAIVAGGSRLYFLDESLKSYRIGAGN